MRGSTLRGMRGATAPPFHFDAPPRRIDTSGVRWGAGPERAMWRLRRYEDPWDTGALTEAAISHAQWEECACRDPAWVRFSTNLMWEERDEERAALKESQCDAMWAEHV